MTGPVLVGLDASGLDSPALVSTVEWCLHTGDELLVVSAYITEQSEMPPDWHDELVAQAHQFVNARIGHRPDELFDADGRLRADLAELAPSLDEIAAVIAGRAGTRITSVLAGSKPSS